MKSVSPEERLGRARQLSRLIVASLVSAGVVVGAITWLATRSFGYSLVAVGVVAVGAILIGILGMAVLTNRSVSTDPPSTSQVSRPVRAFGIALALSSFAMWFAWVETGEDVSSAGVWSYLVLSTLGICIGLFLALRGRRTVGIAVASACAMSGTAALLLAALVNAVPSS